MKVVIADDSVLVREGLARLLSDRECEVVGTAGDAVSAMTEVRLRRPDAVVLDIRMPPTFLHEGLDAANQIRRDHPDTGVLVLSQYLESDYAMRLIKDTPEYVGYLLKDRISDIAVVMDALRRVIVGECVIDPTIVSTLMRRPRGSADPIAALTARERDVLALIAEGRSNAAIAESLAMRPKTLEAHVHRIFQGLGLHESPDDHRRVLAVLTYLRASA